MPRALRYQYPGAVYHLMARGDGGKAVFETDEDRKSFLYRLGKICESHGWRVHAWVLMSNHFHMLVETPEANLVTGMKLLLGTFSQGWNRRRMRRGHVFQGRYKSIPVNASDSDPYYFKIVADYIHLNPARAGLAGGKKGKLLGYRWSSLPSHARGNGPDWLDTGRLLRAFELAGDGRGRRAYVAWLEARAAREGGKIDETAMKALRRGWYLGDATFGDRLLDMHKKPSAKKSRASEAPKAHGVAEAERLLSEAMERLGLSVAPKKLAKLRKGDGRKVLVACLLRQRTAAGNPWIAERLAMGHSGSVSRLVVAATKHPPTMREVEKLTKLLKCDT
jgi:REP element-mobilizing transposase RayT